MCWDAKESLIYMKKRPDGLIDNLAREALVKREGGAIKKLNKILHNYSDRDTKGLDGIIAFDSSSEPRMVGLTTGKTVPVVDYIDQKNSSNALEVSFCMVMPETVRQP